MGGFHWRTSGVTIVGAVGEAFSCIASQVRLDTCGRSAEGAGGKAVLVLSSKPFNYVSMITDIPLPPFLAITPCPSEIFTPPSLLRSSVHLRRRVKPCRQPSIPFLLPRFPPLTAEVFIMLVQITRLQLIPRRYDHTTAGS